MDSGSRILCLIICTFLLSSCVYKKLEVAKKEIVRLKDKNKEVKAQLGTIQEKCVTDQSRYQDSIGRMQAKIDQLINNTPEDLRNTNDSLNQALGMAKAASRQQLQRKKAVEDTLASLRLEMNQLFHVKGSYVNRIEAPGGTYDCYVVNTKQANLKFYWKDDTNKPIRSIQNLQKHAAARCETLLFATNGGMYKPDNAPQGLYIEEGKELRPIDLRKEEYGNFYMQPNGVFFIDTNNIARIVVSDVFKDTLASQTRFATQSGPMAIIDGQINKKFGPEATSKYIRSGVGIINEGTIVFLISNQPVRFYDFASVFLNSFQCKNALYLDGAISKMYLPELGRFETGGNFGPIIGITK